MTVKLKKVDDKTAYENLLVKYAELENKIADIKANCDLAIEGRDIKIKELEQQIDEMKGKHKQEILDLVLSNSSGRAELEQKLEQTEKDLADYQFNYPKIKELEKENNKLLDVINNQDVKIADLEKENERLTVSYETLKLHDEEEIGMLKSENADQKDQLTKAKEIIKNLLILKDDHFGNTKMEWIVEVTEQAEQFLKEIEK